MKVIVFCFCILKIHKNQEALLLFAKLNACCFVLHDGLECSGALLAVHICLYECLK
jgi:hypothetical protein